MSTPALNGIRALLVAAALAAFAFPAPAFAGRLLVTGHDADGHCAGSDPERGQCHFVAVALNYVRAAAPTPSRPLLLLDCSTEHFLQTAVNLGTGGPVPATTMCPSKDADFKRESLTTSRYSAIIVGSSTDLLNIRSQIATAPDSLAINNRAADFTAFFNEGGGILAFSGAFNADGDPAIPDVYYSFLPIPLGGKAVSAPFVLTPAGQSLGFEDPRGGIGTNDDINCCPTHNSFQEPAPGSALQVAERDSTGAPETLFAEGSIGAKTIVSGAPVTGQVIEAPKARKCVRRRSLKLRIRQPGASRIQRATIYVNGRRAKRLQRGAFGEKPSISVRIRRLPKSGFARIRIVVRTTQGVTLTTKKRYRICAKKRAAKKKPSAKRRFSV